MKFQAFTTAVVQDAKIRERIQSALVDNLEKGQGSREFRKVVDAEFDRAGLSKIAPHAINNIYETNVSMAYCGGQMSKLTEHSDAFPFWKFSSTIDSNTRPTHAALHGKIFRTGDYTFYPPLGYRCRCTAIPLTARQAGRYPVDEMPDSKGKKALYNGLGNSSFLGNKQEKFMEWVAKEYRDATPEVRKRIDSAFEIMRSEIRTLEYESFKESFRSPEITRDEKLYNKDKRVQKEAQKLGISKADGFKTYVYTDYKNGLSAELAQYHYNSKAPEKWTENQLLKYKKELAKTFKKLPKYEGVAYRNLDNVPDGVLKQWTNVGGEIVWDSFSSATTDPDKYAERDVRIVIQTKDARAIGDLSMYPEEKEVVLLTGTRLQINSVEKIGKKTKIKAEEI